MEVKETAEGGREGERERERERERGGRGRERERERTSISVPRWTESGGISNTSGVKWSGHRERWKIVSNFIRTLIISLRLIKNRFSTF